MTLTLPIALHNMYYLWHTLLLSHCFTSAQNFYLLLYLGRNHINPKKQKKFESSHPQPIQSSYMKTLFPSGGFSSQSRSAVAEELCITLSEMLPESPWRSSSGSPPASPAPPPLSSYLPCCSVACQLKYIRNLCVMIVHT